MANYCTALSEWQVLIIAVKLAIFIGFISFQIKTCYISAALKPQIGYSYALDVPDNDYTVSYGAPHPTPWFDVEILN